MSTTAILLEFLLSGIQAALWLVLLLSTIFGTGGIGVDKIKSFETIVAVILLPFVYPLGVFVDNLADHILRGWARKIRFRHVTDESQSSFRLLIALRSEWLSSYFDYMRIRTRICRSSALNCCLLTFILPAFIIVNLRAALGASRWTVALAAFFVAAGLTFLAVWSWYRVTNTFHYRVAQGFDINPNKADTGIVGAPAECTHE